MICYKDKTFKQLTKNFSYINPDIEKNFKLEEPRNSEYKVFQFNEYISSENVEKFIKEQGYLPANLYELLAWTEWDEKDWVVALGSVGEVGGDRGVPCLREDGSERRLSLYWWGHGWYDYCRFLAVRNLEFKPSEPLKTELGHSDTLSLERAIGICVINGYEVKKIIT